MRALIATLLVIGVSACGDDGAGVEGPRAHGNDDVGGRIVATVDGVGITIDEVEATVRRTGQTPREALTELENREVLAAEARRRGEGRRRRTDVARARAMVQSFLIERVEGVVTPESIEEEAMRARYEAERSRYVTPALRGSMHFLVEAPANADDETVARARREAAEVLGAARRGDPESVLEAAGAAPGRRFERLPPFPRRGALEEPYAEALFATPVGELHPSVVRTSYGFHVILVTEEVPEEVTTFEEAAPEIREALVLEGRAELLSRILREAADERGVEMEESAIARIAALELGT